MHRYSLFAAPLLSLVSADFYRDVGANWRGKTFLYLLLLLAICWIPMTVKIFVGAKAFADNEAREITRQIPPIKINRGHAVVDAPQPVMIRTKNPDEVVAILDTTGKTTSLEGTTAKFLLTETYMVIKKNERETQRHELKDIDGLELDGPTAQMWVEWGAKWMPLVIYPMFLFGSFVFRIMQALLYSLAGLVMGAIVGRQISYGGVLSVSMMSLTAPILLGTLLELLSVEIPFVGFIGFSLAMGYIAFGMNANRMGYEPTEFFEPPVMR